MRAEQAKAELFPGCLVDSHLVNGNAAQVIGKVNPDLSIKALSTRDVGPGVDMVLCSAVAELTHRHKEIFVSEN
ncbi:uncharacterized protein TrAtP1_011863 [Trichoderma atroviride]|uniref:uncharacterized protein n=1 Tax=Hypocrea atroviridis TaxID=63577 RepID=UPI003326CC95|nr:hypothetical protein TrAtP1_011863 [Trichoderma atroviride]